MNVSNNVLKGMSTSVNQSIRSNTNPSPNNSNNGSMVTHNNSNNNIQNNNVDRTSANTMNMEAKLHHIAGSFRQKRDDAYRQQQLAFERRKLVDEEVTAATQTVKDLHAKLHHLQNQAGCTPAAKEELNSLRAAVTKLVLEVQVQHEEVVMKRNKVQEIRDKMKHTSKKYETIRNRLQKAIQNRRFHLTQLKEEYDQQLLDGGYNNDISLNIDSVPSNENDNAMQMESENSNGNGIQLLSSSSHDDNDNDDDPISIVKKELLLNEIKSDHDGILWKKWSQLIQDKTNSLYNANEKLREEMITLQCVLKGYEKYFNTNEQQQNSDMIVVDGIDQSNQNQVVVEPLKQLVDETELNGDVIVTTNGDDPFLNDDNGVVNPATIQNTIIAN